MLPLFFLAKDKIGRIRVYASLYMNKSASHKYIRRIATGNSKRPWAYIYNESEEAHTNGSNTIQGNAKSKSGKNNGGSGGGDGGEPPIWQIAKLRLELKKELSKYKDKDIVNKKTGNIARIAKTGIEKIGSDKAIEKSKDNGFTVDEHFEVARQVVSLFENATRRSVDNDIKNNAPNLKIERYLSQSVKLQSGKKARAYITVKHTITTDGRRIYSLETMDIKNAPNNIGAWARLFSRSVTSSDHAPIVNKDKDLSTTKGEKSIKKCLFFIYRGRLYANDN